MEQQDDAIATHLLRTLETLPKALRDIERELTILREATQHLAKAMEAMHDTLCGLAQYILEDPDDG